MSKRLPINVLGQLGSMKFISKQCFAENNNMHTMLRYFHLLENKERLLENTRPKPVGHGYVFSMAVGTIGEWLKVVLFFFLGKEQVVLRGGGGGSFLE